jgi:hypothetical protein
MIAELGEYWGLFEVSKVVYFPGKVRVVVLVV